EQRFKTPTQPVSQQWFECSAVGLTQIRLLPGNLSFPFVTLKQPSVAGGLNRLDIATSLSSDAQHHAFLAQLLLIGIVIDRYFSCRDGHRLGRPKERNLIERWQTLRIHLEVFLELLRSRRCGFLHRNVRRIVTSTGLERTN